MKISSRVRAGIPNRCPCCNIVISSWCRRRFPTINKLAPDILVAGGGPAGCAAAIGLRRLGYSVVLVHMPRPWPSIEG
ncbi:MAG: FAD-dependent oxidoreductase, partial [Halieaceae bacterium]|nr:FAD-dependent oxidoreductase [Halieaceae bacterium]